MYWYFWNRFLPELEAMEKTFSTPYTWNSKKQRFSLIRNISYVRRMKNLSVLFALHLPFICWNLLQTVRNERNNLLMLYGLGYTSTTFVLTVIRWMYQNIGREIVQLLNSTVDFQKLNTRPDVNKAVDFKPLQVAFQKLIER
jgi:hypothetical protein